jgi:hypothetical protein
METGASQLENVGSVVEALTDLGLEPVLVGGMALVVLGSGGSPATSTSSSPVQVRASAGFSTCSTIAASNSRPESTPRGT